MVGMPTPQRHTWMWRRGQLCFCYARGEGYILPHGKGKATVVYAGKTVDDRVCWGSSERRDFMTEEIKIRGELTPDPNICKFMVDRDLVEPGWTVIFDSEFESQDSPLIDRLFQVEGLARVRVYGPNIVVTKTTDMMWQELATQIVPAIREALGSDEPPISQVALDAVKQAPQEEIAPTIESLFESHINPALASHGGYARLVKVEDRDVYVEMGGGCQGCAASQATLQYGIESAIRQVAPQVREVVDVTDHASGENPYYS